MQNTSTVAFSKLLTWISTVLSICEVKTPSHHFPTAFSQWLTDGNLASRRAPRGAARPPECHHCRVKPQLVSPPDTSLLSCFPWPILSLFVSWSTLSKLLPKNLCLSSAFRDANQDAIFHKFSGFQDRPVTLLFFPQAEQESKACCRYQSQSCRDVGLPSPCFLLTTSTPQTEGALSFHSS